MMTFIFDLGSERQNPMHKYGTPNGRQNEEKYDTEYEYMVNGH